MRALLCLVPIVLLAIACHPRPTATTTSSQSPAAPFADFNSVRLNRKWLKQMVAQQISVAAVSPDGKVALATEKSIELFGADGRQQWKMQSSDLPTDLAFSPDSTRVYRLEFQRLTTLDIEGKVVSQTPASDMGMQVALASNGNLLINSGFGSLECFSKNGQRLWSFADGGGWSGCTNYSLLAVNPNGSCCFVGLPNESIIDKLADKVRAKLPDKLAQALPQAQSSGLTAYILSSDGKPQACANNLEVMFDGAWREDRLYFVVDHGNQRSFDAMDETGKRTWTYPLPRGGYEPPVFVNDHIWLLGAEDKDGHLLIFEKDGKLVKDVDFTALGHPWTYVSEPQVLTGNLVAFTSSEEWNGGGEQWLWIFSSAGDELERRKVPSTMSIQGAGDWLISQDYASGLLSLYKVSEG